jgi:predicted DNA-binding transcriptional regulator AlpA
MTRFLPKSQVAATLGVSTPTIDCLEAAGDLPGAHRIAALVSSVTCSENTVDRRARVPGRSR